MSALLATTYSYNGQRRVTPDEIEWANTHGARSTSPACVIRLGDLPVPHGNGEA